MPGLRVEGIRFDAHTLLMASLAILVGHQAIVFAICAKSIAIAEGLHPPNRRMERFYRLVTLERGVILSVCAMGIGALLLFAAVNQWRAHNFGDLDYTSTMRLVVPGVTLTALGVQTLFASFLICMLRTMRT
jgi:hypothetical protein